MKTEGDDGHLAAGVTGRASVLTKRHIDSDHAAGTGVTHPK